MTFVEVAREVLQRLLEEVQRGHRRAAAVVVDELTYLVHEAELECLPVLAATAREGLSAARRWEAGEDVSAARLEVVRTIATLARELDVRLF
jgi:hypothetical protein